MLIAVAADAHFQAGPKLPIISAAWNEMFHICQSRGVRVVVFAGDLHDDAGLALGRDASAGDLQSAVLRPILETGIEVVAFPGNHDLLGVEHKSALEYLKGVPNVTVVDQPDIIPVRSGDDTTLLGCIPWAWNNGLIARDDYRQMNTDQITQSAGRVRQTMLHGMQARWHGERAFKLLALHAEIDGARNRYREIPPGSTHAFSVHDLRNCGANDVVAGHYHRGGELGIYVGSLVQLNFGEQDNPTGFTIINTENGQREHVPLDCPHHYTVTVEEFRSLEYRKGFDVVKVRDREVPVSPAGVIDLPEGVKFERIAEPKVARTRAEGVTTESTVDSLLRSWLQLRPQEVGIEALLPRLATAMEHASISTTERSGGAIEAVREVRIRNLGPHRDTHVTVPVAFDGLIGLIGKNGVGKTQLLEALCAALWGEIPSYGVPLYDLTREGFVGEASVEVVFEAQGRTYRALRKLKVTPKTRSQEAYLSEVCDGRDIPVAGPKREDFDPAVTRIAGDASLLFATCFQSQFDHGSIIDMEPGDRMLFARQWVQADRFDAVHQWVRGQVSALQADVRSGESRLSVLAAAPLRVDEVERKIADVERQQATTQELLADHTARLERQQRRIADLQAELRTIEEQRALVARIEQDGKTAKAELDRVQAEIATAEEALSREPHLKFQVARLADLRERRGELMRGEDARQALLAKRQAREADLRALETRIASEVREALQKVEAQRAELQRRIDQLKADERHARLNAKALRQVAVDKLRTRERELKTAIETTGRELAAGVAELQRRTQEMRQRSALVAKAGCGPAVLPCPLIDASAKAAQELPAVEDRLNAAETDLNFENFADAERAELVRVQADLTIALADLDSPVAEADKLEHDRKNVECHLMMLEPPEAADIAVELRAQAVALRDEINAIVVPSKDASLAALEQEISTLASAERDLGGIEVVRQRLAILQQEAQEREAALRQKRAEYQEAAANLRSDVELRAQIGKATQEAEAVHCAITAHQHQATLLAQEVGALQERLRSAQAEVEEAKALISALEDRRQEAREFGVLAEFFSPAGVPQLLIDLALPHLNALLDEILADMGRPFSIEFTTQRVLKNGNAREGLFINVTDEAGCRDIKLHSCGEQNLQRKVVRLALGLFEGQRSGTHHRIFCTDEPTLGLDAERVSQLMGVFYKLATRFHQVWIVSHDAQLLQGVPFRIELEKVNGSTQVVGAEKELVAA